MAAAAVRKGGTLWWSAVVERLKRRRELSSEDASISGWAEGVSAALAFDGEARGGARGVIAARKGQQ